jgi:hypothetical protein
MFQLSTARRFDLEDLSPEAIDRAGAMHSQSGIYWSHPAVVSALRFVGAGEETSIWYGIPTSSISGAAKNAPLGCRRKASVESSKHVGADQRYAPIAAIKAFCVQLRIFTDHEPLIDVATAIDDHLCEPSMTSNLDLGK